MSNPKDTKVALPANTKGATKHMHSYGHSYGHPTNPQAIPNMYMLQSFASGSDADIVATITTPTVEKDPAELEMQNLNESHMNGEHGMNNQDLDGYVPTVNQGFTDGALQVNINNSVLNFRKEIASDEELFGSYQNKEPQTQGIMVGGNTNGVGLDVIDQEDEEYEYYYED